MPRRNVSISEEHLEMLETLDETGVARELFGKSWKSAMYQHIIEKVYRERFDPESIELEKKQLKLERTSDRKQRLEKQVEELREEVSADNNSEEVDEEVDNFFVELVERIENKVSKSRKSFENQYLEWEEGNLKSFNNKFYKIDRQQFRKKVMEKSEQSGHNLDLEVI